MDNFSPEKEINENDQQNSKDLEIENIQFDEIIDVDEIQKKLGENIIKENLGIEDEEDKNKENNALLNQPERQQQQIITSKTLIDPNARKYVIYINPDNVKYMEQLSINERKEVINKILKDEKEHSIAAKKIKETSRFFKHALLVCFTVIIFFPITFIIVNKALEATINNYGQARQNFMKLYKQEGKIKMQG